MSSWQLMFVAFLLLPVVNSLIAFLLPPSKQLIRISSVLFSALILVLSIIFFSAQASIEQITWAWISFGNYHINLVFEFNNLTMPLAITVAFISLLVNIYSVGFFKWDNNQPRYFATLSLFTFSMLGLTLSGNLLQSFVFWELVGLTSYLLIGFYRTKPEAVVASTKALLMNKIGDAGFILALMALFVQSGSLDISELERLSVQPRYSSLIGIGLILAAFSKSAQFPFQSWLPDAMEGPTPISALIHSATMVAAGIFIVIRLHFLFTPESLQVVLIVGAFTAIWGGLRALEEIDFKKILAWSTVSQLGLMMMIIGLSGSKEAYTHLLSHAVFKSGLFLVAGIIISTGSNTISELKKSKKSLLLTISSTILIFSLMGLPLTIGFLSKEYLISSVNSTIFLTVFFVIQVISILYSARILAILYPVNKEKNSYFESIFMVVPVVILASGSVWVFYSPSPFSVQWINDVWGLQPPSVSLSLFNLGWGLAWLAVAIVLIRKNKIDTLLINFPTIKTDKFWQSFIVRPLLFTAQITDRIDNKIIDRGIHGFVYVNFSIALLIRWFDIGWIDGLVRFFGKLIWTIGNGLRQFVAGKIQGYIWWTLVTLVILFILSRY